MDIASLLDTMDDYGLSMAGVNIHGPSHKAATDQPPVPLPAPWCQLDLRFAQLLEAQSRISLNRLGGVRRLSVWKLGPKCVIKC